MTNGYGTGHNESLNRAMKEPRDEERCCAGCKAFTGGEVRHIKACVHYPESLSRIYDEKDEEIARLNILLEAAKEANGQLKKAIMDFEKLSFELEFHSKKYGDSNVQFHFGKSKAYQYTSKKIRELIRWHGL